MLHRTRMTALAITLATAACGSALAAAGDQWYGSNRATYSTAQEVEVSPQPAETSVYVMEAPTVDRYYIVTQPRDVVIASDGFYYYTDPRGDRRLYDPHHPQEGHLVGRGLFNRSGPNDFGN